MIARHKSNKIHSEIHNSISLAVFVAFDAVVVVSSTVLGDVV